MDEEPPARFELDQAITARLDDEPASDAHLQALAVLIEADLTDSERADAFATVITALLARLSPCELRQFRDLAIRGGEATAMTYLARLTAPINEADRS